MYRVLTSEEHRQIGRAINGAALFSNVKHDSCFALYKDRDTFYFKFGRYGHTYSDSTIEGAIKKAMDAYIESDTQDDNSYSGEALDDFFEDTKTSREGADICNGSETAST